MYSMVDGKLIVEEDSTLEEVTLLTFYRKVLLACADTSIEYPTNRVRLSIGEINFIKRKYGIYRESIIESHLEDLYLLYYKESVMKRRSLIPLFQNKVYGYKPLTLEFIKEKSNELIRFLEGGEYDID